MLQRDYYVLEHIGDYCEDIEEVLGSIEKSRDEFLLDKKIQYSIAFSILQIGELVNSLSTELRSSTVSDVEWKNIRGMRNRIVHNYGEIKLEIVWDTAINDIPKLRELCEKLLDEEDSKSSLLRDETSTD